MSCAPPGCLPLRDRMRRPKRSRLIRHRSCVLIQATVRPTRKSSPRERSPFDRSTPSDNTFSCVFQQQGHTAVGLGSGLSSTQMKKPKPKMKPIKGKVVGVVKGSSATAFLRVSPAAAPPAPPSASLEELRLLKARISMLEKLGHAAEELLVEIEVARAAKDETIACLLSILSTKDETIACLLSILSTLRFPRGAAAPQSSDRNAGEVGARPLREPQPSLNLSGRRIISRGQR